MSITKIADLIVPEVFSAYIQQETQAKSRLIQSGALVVDAALNAALAGGGLTFNEPSFKDLDQDEEESVATDNEADTITPGKIQTSLEIQVRLSRAKAYSAMNLAADLAGADPIAAILSRFARYWRSRAQKAFIATITGVYNDNEAAPSGSEHTQNDMTHDISGSSFQDGVTNFSGEAFLDAAVTMGDSMDDLTLVMMHSIVYNRALKNDLIDFIPDSENPSGKGIPTYLGRLVIVDDDIPQSGGVFETWLFGAGAFRLGMGTPKTAPAAETYRLPSLGNGWGQDFVYSRTEWVIHPVGYKYAGTPASGGPTNAATSNNLAHADSWVRVYPERKQIRMARLITREYAV